MGTEDHPMVQQLSKRDPLPSLLPQQVWDAELSEKIQQLDQATLTGRANPSELAVAATRCGLLLWNDDLDGSHTIAQHIEEPLGSYWHGMMHRREGDYSNAKYWFRNAGPLAAFDEAFQRDAQRILPELAQWPSWNPSLFVDIVESAMQGSAVAQEEQLLRIQAAEFKSLIAFSQQA